MWCGGSEEPAAEPLDAAIIFAPVGSLVPLALKSVAKGGTVVLGGIHMSDIPSMRYEILWGERRLCTVANLTRQDATDFLALASKVPLKVHVKTMALQEANSALDEMRAGKLTGAAVLVPASTDKFEALT